MNWPEYQLTFELEDTHWWFVGRRNLALSLLKQWGQLKPDARVLDVGCGTGSNLQTLSPRVQAHGVDISPIALHFARQRLLNNLMQASGVNLPYQDHSFDGVTMFDVLYHRWIVDDRCVLTQLHRVLKPGGWLLLTDSALPLLWSSHDETYFARQRYTLAIVRQKLQQVGFVPCVCSYANFLLLPALFWVRLTMDWLPIYGNIDRHGTSPGWLNRALTQVRTLEARWLSSGKSLPIGGSVICLAQKKRVSL